MRWVEAATTPKAISRLLAKHGLGRRFGYLGLPRLWPRSIGSQKSIKPERTLGGWASDTPFLIISALQAATPP
jgi:hypothetical protein